MLDTSSKYLAKYNKIYKCVKPYKKRPIYSVYHSKNGTSI